jgi:hypothetical protein
MNADDISFEELSESRYPVENDEDGDEDVNGTSFSTTGNITTTFTYAGTSAPTTATTPVYGISFSQPSTVVHAFDLKDMGIDVVGTFDSAGAATGWVMNSAALPLQYPSWMAGQPAILLAPYPDYHVTIRGIFSKHFTNLRRTAIGLSPL